MLKKYLLYLLPLSFITLTSCEKSFEEDNFEAYFGGEIINPQNNFVLFLKNDKVLDTIFYTVKKGDNISIIAANNKVTIDDLKLWNNLENTVVKVGAKLLIQKPVENVAEVATTEVKKRNKYQELKLYIVQKGDSLYTISQKHNTTVADIKKLNGNKAENLQPGMKLKIKA